MRSKLRAVKTEMRRRMHLPIPEQGRWLASVLQGHYNYYAVPDNSEAIRRSDDGSSGTGDGAQAPQPERPGHLGADDRLAARWLPQPRILHPWPDARFDARTQGRSPVR